MLYNVGPYMHTSETFLAAFSKRTVDLHVVCVYPLAD